MQIRNTILVAAESVETREALRIIFENKYDILEAGTYEQTLFLLSQNHKSIAAVILDFPILAEGEGFAAERKKSPYLANIPLLAMIDGGNVQREYEAFSLGAYETIAKPFYPELILMRLSKIIALHSHERNLAQIVEEQQQALYHNNNVMVDTLISIIESRSMESGQHILRIRKFTQILLNMVAQHCPEYGLTEEIIRIITGAAALHDIGKILIPDHIINKPGRLTPEEFTVMKTHSAGGGFILKKLVSLGSEEYMRYAYNICRWHHERWDGGGYPDGLAGEEIPICAQVVGLADAYDALTTDRVYKKAYSCNEAAAMILRGECGVFSPTLLECFKLVAADFAHLAKLYADGHSPEADAITVPLTAPDSLGDNKLLYTVSKYEMLLHYTGDTIAEIDLDQDLYYLVFNPNPDLAFLRNVSTMNGAMEELAEKAVHPDDRELLLQFPEYVETLFREGLQKMVRSYRLKTAGGYRSYVVTTLRIDTDNDRRRVLAIWHPEPGEVTPSLGQKTADIHIPETGMGEFFPFHCRYDRDLTFCGDSLSLCTLLGLEEAAGLLACIVPSQRESVTAGIRECLSRGNHFAVECRLLTKESRTSRAILSGSRLTEPDGRECLRGVLHDISAISYGEPEEVLQKRDFLLAAYRPEDDIFVEWDGEKNALCCLSGNAERLGLRGRGDEYLRLMQMHPDDASFFLGEMERLEREEGKSEMNLRIAGRMGRYTANRLRLASHMEGNRLRIVGLMMDVESPAQIRDESREQDTLTGLPDKDSVRRQIENRLDLTGGSILSALLIVDLDNFKTINSTYGHLFGDAMLMRAAEAIGRELGGNDLLTRIGGDEFLVYLHDVRDRETVMTVSTAVSRAVGEVFRRELPENPVTCSVGIACTPDHGKTYELLLQCADRALYGAKTRGKDCAVLYDPSEVVAAAPTMVGVQIDSGRDSNRVGGGLAQYVFSRLYESGDVDVTIRTILEIVGRQMDVSRVYIFENNFDNTLCSNTYEWCAEGVSPEIDNLQNVSYETDIPGYSENFDSRGVFFVHDVDALPQHLKDILKPQGICSMLQCAILDGGEFRGYVGFDDNNRTRVWEKEQIEILSFLARILSVFILKQRTQNTTANLIREMDRIMDACFDWVYVVDPSTFQLKFINRRIRESIPTAKRGKHCYEVFMNRTSPCENCPIFCGEGGYSARIDSPVVGTEVMATGNHIHWNGENLWLLTCHETKEGRMAAPAWKTEPEKPMMPEEIQQLLLRAYRAVLDATPAMTFVKDKSLRYRGATDSFAKMMGVDSEEELIGKTDLEILGNQDLAQKYMSDDRQLMGSGEQMVKFVEPLPDANGQPRYASTMKYVVRDGKGEIAGLAGFSRDVTREMVASRNHQRELEYLFSLPEDTYFSQYMDITTWSVITEKRQEIRGVTMQKHSSMEELSSLAFQNVVDRRGSAYSFWRDFSRESVLAIYQSGKRDIVMEYLRRVSPEEVRWVRDEFKFLTDPQNGHLCMVMLVRDIHEKKEEERRILWAAKRDGLTGLLNRSAMMDYLKDFLSGDNANHNHAIFAIDLDGFKRVNDTYGHKRGDEFLTQMANAIRGSFRETDLVGRIGGDEFLVLMKFTPTEDVVREKAQNLLSAMQNVCGELTHLGVSGSVGISIFGDHRDGTELDALLEKADRALYRAKASGKNCAVMASDVIEI